MENQQNYKKQGEFFNTLLEILKQDKRFFSENGTFLRNAVYEATMQMDVNLIHLLLSNSEAKARFFKEVDGILVFDKIGFALLTTTLTISEDD